jgi:hypothetical protein
MVDYSKWDRLAVEEEEERPRARVTRLEGPSTLTIGPAAGDARVAERAEGRPEQTAAKGRARVTDYDRWEELVREMSEDDEGEGEDADIDEPDDDFDDRDTPSARPALGAGAAPGAAPAAPALSATPIALSAAPSATQPLPPSASLHGAETEGFVWSQTKTEVTLNFVVPPSARAKEVRLNVGRDHVELSLSGCEETFAPFVGELAHPVDCSDDPDELDWELRDPDAGFACGDASHCRWVRLVLAKQMPAGVVVWWDRVFRGDAPVDVTRFAGRQTDRAAQMETNWKEAHELFRQRVRDRQKVEV